MENQHLNEPSKDQSIDNQQTGKDSDVPPRQHFYEETAAEFTNQKRIESTDNDELQNIYGWLAVALSVLSFFWIPILFAGAGIILGFVARGRDAKVLGTTAIVIGILSILTRLIIIPLI